MVDQERLQDQVSTYADHLQEPVNGKDIFFLISGKAGEEDLLLRLYDSMKKHPRCQEYSIHCAVTGADAKMKRWCRQRGIALIPWEGKEYLRLLATSAYLLSDVTLPIYFMRRQEQSYWALGVIRDAAARRRKNRPAYDEDMFLERLGQNFLQCTHILASSEADIRLLKKDYLLEDMYGGQVCRIDDIHQPDESADQKIELLRDLILGQDPQNGQAEIIRFTAGKSKHRVLIQLDWNKRDWLREWLPLWLEYVDYEKYDVTLVSSSPKGGVNMSTLAGLPKQVRVLLRRGYILLGARQKMESAEYTKDFWLMPEEERRDGHPEMQVVYAHEWRKIFGWASFDTMVLTALDPLWYLGAEKSCADKVFICTREIARQASASQMDQEKWKNKWAAVEKMKACYWFGTEGTLLGNTYDRFRKLPTPVPAGWLREGAEDTAVMNTFWYQGREYALLLQGSDWRELRGQVEYIPIPQTDQNAYVASGHISDVLAGFKALREREPDSLLYVFTGDEANPLDGIEAAYRECVVPIGRVVCGKMQGARTYLSRFRGGLIHGDDDPGSLAVLMGILGRPVYRENGGQLEEISIQIDKEDLYEKGKDLVARIWEIEL